MGKFDILKKGANAAIQNLKTSGIAAKGKVIAAYGGVKNATQAGWQNAKAATVNTYNAAKVAGAAKMGEVKTGAVKGWNATKGYASKAGTAINNQANGAFGGLTKEESTALGKMRRSLGRASQKAAGASTYSEQTKIMADSIMNNASRLKAFAPRAKNAGKFVGKVAGVGGVAVGGVAAMSRKDTERY